MKKRLLSFLLVLCCVLSISVHAYEFPQSFWAVNEQYTAAMENENYLDIITFAEQEIDIMLSEEDCSEKTDILVSRYHQMGMAYAALGAYEKSAEALCNSCRYAQNDPEKYGELMRGMKRYIAQYTSEISLYTDGGTAPYYKAINEKENGVLFGVCSDSETRGKMKNESMTLVFQSLDEPLYSYNAAEIEWADGKGIALELALNCTNEGEDIRSIRQYGENLQLIADAIKEHPNLPVYLRFGAEFDVWTNSSTPQEYIEAFRYVADFFHRQNKNVAMVWSPNQVSAWNVDADDFYPGDAYVDWVGMSFYAQEYFLGDPTQSEENQLFFEAGENADPVVSVAKIVEKYGDRKPIMISEFGCGHTLLKTGEKMTDFAVDHLQKMLCNVPMVYPQVKLIAYFDRLLEDNNEKNDYRLSTDATLQKNYLSATRQANFVQAKYGNSAPLCYRKVENGMWVESIFPVACYAHIYGEAVKSVIYYLDGQYAGMAEQVPYLTYIDAAAFTGQHTLKAVVTFASGATRSVEKTVAVGAPDADITVTLGGQTVEFDQKPVVFHDRTLVPMRKIFEALGATVSWDEATQTAKGQKGDLTVEVTVGSAAMYVNGKAIVLDVNPIVLSDRTLVPLRAVADGMNCTVEWIAESNTVKIEPIT